MRCSTRVGLHSISVLGQVAPYFNTVSLRFSASHIGDITSAYRASLLPSVILLVLEYAINRWLMSFERLSAETGDVRATALSAAAVALLFKSFDVKVACKVP